MRDPEGTAETTELEALQNTTTVRLDHNPHINGDTTINLQPFVRNIDDGFRGDHKR